MKKQISWGLTASIIAAAMMYYSFYINPPWLEAHPNSQTNEVTFSISPVESVKGSSAYVKIFLSHGDGTYWIGSHTDLANHKHIYPTPNKSYTAYAEVIYAYDDDKKPPKKTNKWTFTTSSQAVGSLPANPSLGGKKIVLGRTTNAVPGDSITYIITYEHSATDCPEDTLHGKIIFTHPTALSNYSGDFLSYFGESEGPRGSNTIEYQIPSLLPGQQRSIFVPMKTDALASLNTALNPNPHVKLILYDEENRQCSPDNASYEDAIYGQMITNSHDPNYKSVVQNNLCKGDYVTWRVDFQNEGNGPESTIVISDRIDTLFEYESVAVVSAPSRFTTVTPIRYSREKREWRFKMIASPPLEGLGKRGVREDDTKGHIVFKAKKRAHLPCNAAANAARIFFGHNPPVFTKTELAPFPCDTSNCEPCVILKDLMFDSLTAVSGDTLISYYLLESAFGGPPPNNWTYKWYPTIDLDNPFLAKPILTRAVDRVYTLVASNPANCATVIVRVHVRPSEPLGLTYSLACSNNLWNVTATATPSNRSASSLFWNTSASNTISQSSFPLNLSGGQVVYFGVWDTLTDQVAEAWVPLPLACPGSKIPWWLVAVALGVLVLLVVVARFLFGRPR